MVLPQSSLPRNVVAPQSSYRRAQPSNDVGSSGPTSSVSSFQNTTGDLPSGSTDTYARDETPVQDSQQDRNKSEMHCLSPPSQWSEGFIVYSNSVHSEAIEAGVSPSSSRQLKDLMQELKHKSSELEFANKRISLLESRICELERIGHSELELANKQIDLFKSRVCDLTKQQEKDREEHKSEIAEMLKRMEGMQLECRANTEQRKALKEENETLRKEHETLKEAQQRAAAVEKCEEFEERKTLVRRLSEEHYDTTQQLDYALQSVLDKKGVDEEFKKKVRELKKEVEERKLHVALNKR